MGENFVLEILRRENKKDEFPHPSCIVNSSKILSNFSCSIILLVSVFILQVPGSFMVVSVIELSVSSSIDSTSEGNTISAGSEVKIDCCLLY